MSTFLFRSVAVACFIVAIEALTSIPVFKDLRHLRKGGNDVSYEEGRPIGTVPKTIKNGEELFEAVKKLLIDNGVSDGKIESIFAYRNYDRIINSKTSVIDITEEDIDLTLGNYSRIEVTVGVDVKVIPILTLRKKGKGTQTGSATPSGSTTPTGSTTPSGSMTPTGSAAPTIIVTRSSIAKKKPIQKIRLPAWAATLKEICIALQSMSIRLSKITRIVANNKGNKDRLISTKCDLTSNKAISTAELTLFITVDPAHQPRLFLDGDELKMDDDDEMYLPAFEEDEPTGLSIWKQMMIYSNNNATQVFTDNDVEIHPNDSPFNLTDTKSLLIITEAATEITVNGPGSDVKKEVPIGKYVHWLKLQSDLMSLKEYQSIKSIKGNDLYITIDKDGFVKIQTNNKSDIFDTSKLGELTVYNEV